MAAGPDNPTPGQALAPAAGHDAATAGHDTATAGRDTVPPAPRRPRAPRRITLPPSRLPSPPPAELLAGARFIGSALHVRDLEAQRRWYETLLGLQVVQIYERDGAVFEYLLQPPGGGAIVALMQSAQRPPGGNACSRLILQVPDAEALCEQLHARGVPTRLLVAGMACMVQDPEGNDIELYTSPPTSGA